MNTNNSPHIDPQTNYFSVALFSQKHPAFSDKSLRFMIFKEHENGMAKHGVVVRVGRKVLINEQNFMTWIESHSSNLGGK